MLSPHYSLQNLTATSQQLSQPNLPGPDELENLTYLADFLEQLTNEIGHFTILSGFRTKELQDVLASKGEPTASGTSFHEKGRGVDIAPTTMTPAEFFGRLLANENLKNMCAEIAIKLSQGALHLAINVPSDTRDPKVLGLNSEGVYARLTLEDILTYIEPYMPSAEVATSYAEAQLVTYNRTPMLLAAAGALALSALLLLKKGSRTKSNPRIKAKPFKKYGHLSDDKIDGMTIRIFKKLGEDVINGRFKPKSKRDKKLYNLFFDLSHELDRRNEEQYAREREEE